MIRFFAFVLLLSLSYTVEAANKLDSVRIWDAPNSTRVVLDLSKAPDYSYFSLSNPQRLVIDLKDASTKVKFESLAKSSKLINKVRLSSPPKKGTLRLVLELTSPVKPSLFALTPTAPYGNRLVVDLDHSGNQSAAKKSVVQTSKRSTDVIVAIDAGHGGEDPGSIGPKGTYEKKVVLAISKRLERKINETPGMKAVMTRSGDYFVNLNQRSELARTSRADLLLSIHADAFTTPHPKGASVWVLSKRRANTEIGRVFEDKEKHSELLGGVGDIIQNSDSEQYLVMTLIDMSMDHSMAESHSIASDILAGLGTVTKLHKNKPESASFAVLKSTDIPSILIETGFISNPKEEKQLLDGNHQQRLANAIHKGVVNYFEANAPAGTLFAKQSNVKHTVRSGDSLSVIAQRYKVSVSSIKKSNNLKSDVLRIGQKLVIPRA
ncbi:N-acetylmuramoyl-L-alanine amidase [Shewanella olleyana]|uniref:N-acetylmuramoyl-L-alanine amidase n=1 Tax=Shewanella olleyana TaxID=135626 RepID=UPI00200FD2BC|nr:N-acetylmuramoyl-L-alanine amidase [Shewanella olleyana]MCL1066787.1 N-acetylmuramoyl-L-alanine amidase [Shewanella olleyana]